ncbi:winged helix-turn-helix domain-containing protein [Psychrosphaera haliotis]|nr:winged helix-turn-helix domain-containing protein [Psychrosphaera haliotis]
MKVELLNFDENSNSIVFKGRVMSLNRLSFKLLRALGESNGEILSANQISSTVWGNSTVSSETIKQRVFVLRKAIMESGIEGIIVQSVRGEGYRLIIDDVSAKPEPEVTSTKRTFYSPLIQYKTTTLTISLLMLAIIASIYIFRPSSNELYINDRIALWTNIKPHKLINPALTVYSNWNDKLLTEMKENNINLVFSEKQQDVLVPVQARRNRLALISYFEVLKKNEKYFVTLSIVEPKTATVLRKDSFELTPDFIAESLLNSQINGITKLLSSGKLNLTKQHKENPKHRIWPYLKALANEK